MKRKIMSGKGKNFSKIAREVEADYKKWLRSSEIDEEEFMYAVEDDDFYLTFFADDTMALVTLHNDEGEIAMPLIWQKENGIKLKAYKLDTALLLAYVGNKCANNDSKHKIKEFICEHLVEKM